MTKQELTERLLVVKTPQQSKALVSAARRGFFDAGELTKAEVLGMLATLLTLADSKHNPLWRIELEDSVNRVLPQFCECGGPDRCKCGAPPPK